MKPYKCPICKTKLTYTKDIDNFQLNISECQTHFTIIEKDQTAFYAITIPPYTILANDSISVQDNNFSVTIPQSTKLLHNDNTLYTLNYFQPYSTNFISKISKLIRKLLKLKLFL